MIAQILDKRFTFVKQSSDSSRSNPRRNPKVTIITKILSTIRYSNTWTEIRNAQPVNKKIRKVVTDTANPLIVDVDTAFVGDRCYIYIQRIWIIRVSSQPTTDITKGKVATELAENFLSNFSQQHIYIPIQCLHKLK